MQDFSGFPVYADTKTQYLTPGERKLEVLKRKAGQGVLVRLIYDDMGCFFTLPNDYPAQLKRFGIQCAVFNPFRPLLSGKQNNRNHRKVAVVDGKVAFTGGINLADEYINAIEKHGHWKDSAIMLAGRAAWSFTLIFLQMWELCTHADENYADYYPWKEKDCPITAEGFVQPYADSPMTEKNNPNIRYTIDFDVTPHQLWHTYITNQLWTSIRR